ncbi:amidohydrolase family protein [Aliidiomarina halalkaliphila]|uniref:Amidohydrolase family protein n=1 Tax=Aliidiomarina halalkaliphila TaxID=2593535 RepID=A0A552X0S3_9GAMM|nr:amidohydrolase family protein [Aliidiomarina halalkaliphila]TRW48489.1 amidohydrolase family protein [Aliidiomarina halalkaliphila]
MIRRMIWLVALVTIAIPPAFAEKVALVGGRLIDGYVSPPLVRSVILIEDGIIQKVGTVDTLPVPEGYREVPMWGHDVMPGLWENHAHLQLVGHADYIHWQAEYADRFVDEIMPAAALQLLLAGVTSVRDLGAPLEDSTEIKRKISSGEIPGPNLYVSGPFLQHKVDDWQANYRWRVTSVSDARSKVRQLHEAGMDIVKLIEHDEMEFEVAQAIVDEAHDRGMVVVAHAHRPNEIRVGLKLGVDNFEHTGLTTAPGYPQDILDALKERTAVGIFDGLLFWTPTVEGLWNYQHTVENPTRLDDPCWHEGLAEDTIADIHQSIRNPAQLGYTQLTPLRRGTLKNKINQLKETGVVMLVGTDSGIPMKFHCQSTWQEMAFWVDEMGFDAQETIRAATYWPAVMMGVADRYGSVSEGKVADIIAVRGDVLRYMNLLQRVDFVMKDGVVYKQDGQVNRAALAR